MRRLLYVLLNSLLISGLLAGCGNSPTRAPGATPTLPPPNATPTPLPPAPKPTVTPAPTAAPTATPLPTIPAALATPVPEPAQPIDLTAVAGLRELARWGRGRPQEVEYSSGGHWLVVRAGLSSYLSPGQNLAGGQSVEGSLYLAPDEKNALTVSKTGRVDLWQVEGWKRTASLAGRQAAFSPEGSLAAVVGAANIQLVRLQDGSPLRSLDQPGVEREVFTRDGAVLVAASQAAVQVWQVSDGQALKKFDYERVMRLAFTADNSLLLVQARNLQNEAIIDIYRLPDWELAGTIPASGSFVVQPDGKRLFLYSNFPTPGKIESFDLPDGKPGSELRAGGSIYRLAISPDSKLLVASIIDYSASNQQTYGYLKTFETGGKELKRLDCGIFCEAQQPAISPDSKLLAVAGLSSISGLYVGATFLFDARSGERLRTLLGGKIVSGPLVKVVFSPDGQNLVTLNGAGDDAVRVWKAADGSLLSSLDWSADTLNMEDLAQDGSQVAAYSDAGMSKLLKAANGEVLKQIDRVIQPRFGRGVEWVAAADLVKGKPEGVRLLNAANAETLTTFPKNLAGPLTFSPVEDLGVFFKDFSAQLVKLPSGAYAGTLTATGKPNVRLTVGAFSPDGKLLAAGSVNGEVWLWQVAEKKQWKILEGHKNQVSTLLFSKDGSLLLTGSIDGAVLVWQTSDGKLINTLRSTDLLRNFSGTENDTFGQLAGLALSPDGALIAVSGYLNPLQPAPARQGVVLLLDAANGALLRVLPGGGGKTAFSPDGKLLYSSGDGAVHAWGSLP